jgi:hypothetical protein
MFGKLSAITAAIGFVLAAPAAGVGTQELCFGATPTISGSGAINGTMGDDVILGSEGADEIHAFAGNDKICAGGGDDKVGGGPGNDEIDGGPGNDELEGGPGNDTILGGEGDDVARCGPDNDVFDGGPGLNTAETAAFEACESVTNASPPQTEPTRTVRTLKATLGPGRRGALSATLTVSASGATLAWRLTFKGLTGPIRASHIHGQTGGILVRLCGPCRSGMSGTTQVNGQPARMAILQGKTFVDVHTKTGVIRGRIVTLRG